MCTVTLIQGPWLVGTAAGAATGRWRLVCNRDERRDRPAALQPTVAIVDGTRVVRPIDPTGGGTWIAVTDAGLAFVLLNRYDAAADDRGTESRGLIIPTLAGARALDAAGKRLAAFDVRRVRPFELLALDDARLLHAWSDGRVLRMRERRGTSRVCLTSSSVETRRVRAWRLASVRRHLTTASAAAQDEFHRLRHPARDAYGILMSRPDARTVSTTRIELWPDRVVMQYDDGPATTPGAGGAGACTQTLTRVPPD
jgi:hypothetical protein